MRAIVILSLSLAALARCEPVLFEDDFKQGLKDGWKWVREDPEAWRTTARGLELRVLPGNMWGGANNAKNVLVRPVATPKAGLEITVQVENRPTEQYEQVDLVWYYDDSNMVKIGLELVDGKLCVVMGREEKDRTRTLALIRKATPSLGLRFQVRGTTIAGFYRPAGSDAWIKAAEGTLPAHGKPHLSLQAYQGPAKTERWARITGFRIRTLDSK